MRAVNKCNYNCIGCPNNQNKNNPEQMQGIGSLSDVDTQMDVLFIRTKPGQSSSSRRSPFSDKTDVILNKLIKRVFPKNFGLAYAVECYGLASPSVYKQCKHHLAQHIKKYKPKIVVPLGKKALDLIDGSKGSPTYTRGLFWQTQIGDQTVTISPSWTPSQFFKSFNLMGSFIQDLTLIKQYIDFGKNPFAVPTDFKYSVLTTIDQVTNWVTSALDTEGFLAFDTETKNLNKRHDQRLGTLQFSDGKTTVVIPYDNPGNPWLPEDKQEIKAQMNRLFTEKPKFKAWICHGGKFDQLQVMNFITGQPFQNVPMLDTMNGMHLIDENRKGLTGYGLEGLARELLGWNGYGDYKKQRTNTWDMKKEDLYHYGAMDAIVTHALFSAERNLAIGMGFKGWLHLLSRLIHRTNIALTCVEHNGFYGDRVFVQNLKSLPTTVVKKRKAEILESFKTNENAIKANALFLKETKKITTKGTFGFKNPKKKVLWVINLNKKAGMIKLFFDVMGLEPLSYGKEKSCLRKTKGLCNKKCVKQNCSFYKTPEPSIGKAFYEHYNYIKEVVLISEWVSLDTLEDKFITPVCNFLDKNYTGKIKKMENNKDHSIDSRIRGNYNTIGTVTGRLSSSNPNMQQIPRGKAPAPNAIKNIFRAENHNGLKKGEKVDAKDIRCLVQMDYKANEVGWWCIASGDKVLASKLWEGKNAIMEYKKNPTPENLALTKIKGDIHKQTASQMFGVRIEDVLEDQRQATKTIVFGLMYGRSVKSIAQQLSLTQWDKDKESWDEFLAKVTGYCKMFEKQFVVATKYLQDLPDKAQKYGYVQSPIGRRRNLWAYLVGIHIWNANNQAKNSPIQGVASDAACIGGSLVIDYINKNNKDWQVTAMVHDSIVTEIPLNDLHEFCNNMEDLMTIEVMRYMKEKFNVNFIAPIQVDFEVSTAPLHAWGTLTKWDYSQQDLDRIYQEGMSHEINEH